LATILFSAKNVNPLALNVFHLKPLFADSDDTKPLENPVINSPTINKQIVIAAADMEKILTASAADYISSPTVRINQNDVKVSGNLIKPVKTTVDLTLKVNAKNQKVNVEITELKTGALGAPGWVKATLTDLINKRLDAEVNNKYKVEGVSQETGKIIVKIK
jgi:hypothetical protein